MYWAVYEWMAWDHQQQIIDTPAIPSSQSLCFECGWWHTVLSIRTERINVVNHLCPFWESPIITSRIQDVHCNINENHIISLHLTFSEPFSPYPDEVWLCFLENRTYTCSWRGSPIPPLALRIYLHNAHKSIHNLTFYFIFYSICEWARICRSRRWLRLFTRETEWSCSSTFLSNLHCLALWITTVTRIMQHEYILYIVFFTEKWSLANKYDLLTINIPASRYHWYYI